MTKVRKTAKRTVHDLYAFAERRHGKQHGIGPLAEETGYGFSGMDRLTLRDGGSHILARLEREIRRLEQYVRLQEKVQGRSMKRGTELERLVTALSAGRLGHRLEWEGEQIDVAWEWERKQVVLAPCRTEISGKDRP